MQTREKVIWGSGAVGSAATAGTYLWTTAMLSGPVANLGGYATAQILLGGGPALSATIAMVGPVAAGVVAATGVGVAIVSLGYGGYHLSKWVRS